jgi:hypothetical protein
VGFHLGLGVGDGGRAASESSFILSGTLNFARLKEVWGGIYS